MLVLVSGIVVVGGVGGGVGGGVLVFVFLSAIVGLSVAIVLHFILFLALVSSCCRHTYHDELVVPVIENTAREEDLADSLADAISRYPTLPKISSAPDVHTCRSCHDSCDRYIASGFAARPAESAAR